MRAAVHAVKFALCAVVACAAPAISAAAPVATKVMASAHSGLSLPTPGVIQSVDKTTIFGLVCRAPGYVSLAPVSVRAERLDAGGLPILAATTATAGALRARGGPCRAYSLTLAAPVTADETIRVCAGPAGGACAIASGGE